MEKTYKRELAVALLGVYLALNIAGIWFPEAAAQAEAMKFETFAFLAGAFALDAVAKQIKR